MNTSDTTIPSPEQVRDYITQRLSCTHLSVEGDGRHFSAVIISPAFEGLNRVKRHQLVYAALGERMKEEIHALSMSTYTPGEYAQMQQ